MPATQLAPAKQGKKTGRLQAVAHKTKPGWKGQLILKRHISDNLTLQYDS